MKITEDIIQEFIYLFNGRSDVYALRVENGDRAVYLPSDYKAESSDPEKLKKKKKTEAMINKIVESIGSPHYDAKAVLAHLEGKELLGIYPIHPDNNTFLFAFDLDGKKGDPWEATKKQYEILTEEANLPVYIERSQSGNGYHIWGFLNGPVHAGIVRKALAPFIEDSEVYDRMYPVQPSVGRKGYGNLIALPLNGDRLSEGNSAFVEIGSNGEPHIIEDQYSYLFEIESIDPQIMRDLADEAPEDYDTYEVDHTRAVPPESLGGAHKLIHPNYGCEFVRWAYDNPGEVNEPLWYALACNFAQLRDGRKLFHEWSAQDGDRYDAENTDRKFDHALEENKPHTCESIRNIGGNCECDIRFPGRVTHPFDIVKLPFKMLVQSIEGQEEEQFVQTGDSGFEGAVNWMHMVQNDPKLGIGHSYGIDACDEKGIGLRNSDLIIWAGRPGSGKTSLSLFVADYLASKGIPVYYFSIEMAKEQLWRKLLVIRSGVPFDKVKRGQLTDSDWEKIERARKGTSPDKYPLFVDDVSSSVDRIFEVFANLVHQHGKGVGMMDYLQQLARKKGENEQDLVMRASLDLKLLAKAVDCPFLALSQLNREADDAGESSEPSYAWMRGGGYQEQVADNILYILGREAPGVVKRSLYMKKDRFGNAGFYVDLEFDQGRGLWLSPRSFSPIDTHNLPEVDNGNFEEGEGGLWGGL